MTHVTSPIRIKKRVIRPCVQKNELEEGEGRTVIRVLNFLDTKKWRWAYISLWVESWVKLTGQKFF